jgi:hypothetical protein
MSKPQCFGFIPVVTSGTNVPLAANTSTTQLQVQSSKAWTVQAIRANGVVNTGYVALGVVGMNRLTGAGVIAYLAPGTTAGSGTFFNSGTNSDSADYDLDQIVIDAPNAGDGVILTSFA